MIMEEQLIEQVKPVEVSKQDLQIGLKLQQFFEMNLLSTGKLEISNLQLAEATGKAIRGVNRDIVEEFSTVRKRSEQIMFTDDNYNGGLLAVGLERLKERFIIYQD